MSQLSIEPMKEPDKIINYWKKEPFVVACIVGSGLLYNGMLVLGPVLQGKLIDSIARVDPLSTVGFLGICYVAAIGLIQLMRYIKRFYIRRFANSTSATMRRMIYNNIMNRRAEELDTENAGNLMTRTISDVELCVEGMRKFSTEVFDTGVLMLSYLVCMLSYDVKVTVLACVFTPLAMLLAEKLKKLIYRFSREYRTATSRITDLTYDRIQNAMLYRVGGMEERNLREYETELEDWQNKAIKASILENSMSPIYRAIAMLGILAVVYFGGGLVLSGGWSVGQFSAYIAMFLSVTNKAGRAAKLMNSVQRSQVSWQRIKPYLGEYKEAEGDPRSAFDLDLEAGSAADAGTETPESSAEEGLVVKDLGFTYPGSDKPVFSQVNFSAKPGEIIGVTGPIACGKSTLGLALQGLYPYEGSIRLSGRELSRESALWRSGRIAAMEHDPHLLSDTIYENITLGEPAEVTEILDEVRFSEDLRSMPLGQETMVGSGGVRLSGGQQARIALARTLVGEKRLIILDDPFSAVDMKTEEEIIQRLRARCQNSVVILISHRLAVFDRVDRIILMHGEKEAGIIEYGTHEELLGASKLYGEIVKLQQREGEDCHGA